MRHWLLITLPLVFFSTFMVTELYPELYPNLDPDAPWWVFLLLGGGWAIYVPLAIGGKDGKQQR